MKRQWDTRIHPEDLGMVDIGGQRFVVNLRPGVPFNACIEEFNGLLRCWASRVVLDVKATLLVRWLATETEDGAFVWKKQAARGPLACIKGEHELYRVAWSRPTDAEKEGSVGK